MSKRETQPKQVVENKPVKDSDSESLDGIQYLECKLTLKPDGFESLKGFKVWGPFARRAADELDIGFSAKGVSPKPQLREVEFLDTKDFKLYSNSFILRRRVPYEGAFPSGDPEIVFKFRNPDRQKVADMDVRPKTPGGYRIKFKAEMLPLKDKLGGYRLIFSHNAQFNVNAADEKHRVDAPNPAGFFPCLQVLSKPDDATITVVNQIIVEEVLLNLGTLDFGKGVTADSSVALWRERGTHKPLVAEISFECKFKGRDEVPKKTLKRITDFFVLLQKTGGDRILLGTTKTAVVYKGMNVPHPDE
jgi:hypothetical protein